MPPQEEAPAQRGDTSPSPPPSGSHLARTREPPGDNSLMRLPVELGEFFQESKNKLDQLREVHPWLCELDKTNELDLSSLRQEFLTDGHTFMSALGKFLNARKWQEFVICTCNYDSTHGPVLRELLNIFYCAGAPPTRVSINILEKRRSVLNSVSVSDEGQTPYSRLEQAIKSRRVDSVPFHPRYVGRTQKVLSRFLSQDQSLPIIVSVLQRIYNPSLDSFNNQRSLFPYPKHRLTLSDY